MVTTKVTGPCTRRQGHLPGRRSRTPIADGVDDGIEQPRMALEIVEQHEVATCVMHRHPPIGVLLIGSGLIHRTPIPHDIGQADTDESRR